MAADLERLAREFREAGHSEITDGINDLVRLARKLHAPESFSTIATPVEYPITPNVDLRQQTYDLLSQVIKQTSDEAEALKKRGIKFLPVVVGLDRKSTRLNS